MRKGVVMWPINPRALTCENCLKKKKEDIQRETLRNKEENQELLERNIPEQKADLCLKN